MAKAGSRQKRRRNRRRNSVALPQGAVMGLLILAGAGLLAWNLRDDLASLLGAASGDPPPVAVAASKKASKPVREQKPGDAEAAGRFEFYDMLPAAEVDVAEQPQAAPVTGPPPVSLPGAYVVQAGAFPSLAAADKVKVRLAVLGVVSEIQAADANGAVFHRVRIGPIENLDELNRLRARLRQNGIEHQVIPIGE